jgi:4-hydroxy-tetrahydrodipicolinate synthase
MAAPDVDLRGLWVPVVTPFTVDGNVDLPSLRRLANRLLADGATGLVALGTTGEPATLTADERRRAVDVVAEVCAGRDRPFLIGAGTNSTRTTVDEVAHWNAAAPGLTALLVVVPYYTRPSEAGIVAHLQTAAAASERPVVVYNIPHRTGRGLGSAALLELAHTGNVAGVKQSVGAFDDETLRLLAGAPEGFAVLSGDDSFIAPTVLLGGAGAVAAAAHVRTAAFRQLVDAALAGDARHAAALARSLGPTIDAGIAEPSPAVWKAALCRLGLIDHGGVRAPMTGASPAAADTLVATLQPDRRPARGGPSR